MPDIHPEDAYKGHPSPRTVEETKPESKPTGISMQGMAATMASFLTTQSLNNAKMFDDIKRQLIEMNWYMRQLVLIHSGKSSEEVDIYLLDSVGEQLGYTIDEEE